jgi:hypothetical protein
MHLYFSEMLVFASQQRVISQKTWFIIIIFNYKVICEFIPEMLLSLYKEWKHDKK